MDEPECGFTLASAALVSKDKYLTTTSTNPENQTILFSLELVDTPSGYPTVEITADVAEKQVILDESSASGGNSESAGPISQHLSVQAPSL